MKTATLVQTTLGKHGDTLWQAVYRLEPPMTGNNGQPCEYVLCSAAYAPPFRNVLPAQRETYIFPCRVAGDVLDWEELPGSQRGTLEHAAALERAGYTIVEGAQ